MIAFGWVTNLVQRGRASWGRMREILEIVPAIDDRDVAYPELTPEDIRGDVTDRQSVVRLRRTHRS